MSGNESRRQFLQRAGVAAAGLLASACCPRALIETVESTAPADPTVAPTPVPTVIPTSTSTAVPSATSTSVLTGLPTSAPTSTAAPTATPTGAPTSAPTAAPTATLGASFRSRVAIGQAASYDWTLIHQQVEALIDGIGGLGDVVRPGDRVAIKVNLTGGSLYGELTGKSQVDSYFTHPEVVRALGELVRDAGAGEIFIVEAIFDAESYSRFTTRHEERNQVFCRLNQAKSPPFWHSGASQPPGKRKTWFLAHNVG